MIELAIPRRCPSIQGRRVGKRLSEWRTLIYEVMQAQGLLEGSYKTVEDGIRQIATQYLNGPCRLDAEFYLRATKNVTDLDNMLSFIITCFRTEITQEAQNIEEEFGARPWFYYRALGYPGILDFWQAHGRRYDGGAENRTSVRIRRLEPAEYVA